MLRSLIQVKIFTRQNLLETALVTGNVGNPASKQK